MRKKPAVVLSGDGWLLTEHACRFCAARVLTRADGVFRCSTCAAVSTTGTVEGICGCGMHLGPQPKTTRERGRRGDRAPQAFRCTGNPEPSPMSPSLFLIGYLEEPAPAEPAHG